MKFLKASQSVPILPYTLIPKEGTNDDTYLSGNAYSLHSHSHIYHTIDNLAFECGKNHLDEEIPLFFVPRSLEEIACHYLDHLTLETERGNNVCFSLHIAAANHLYRKSHTHNCSEDQ